MQYYPDTPLPRNESAQEYECAVLVAIGAPPKGLRGFGEKEESWQRLVGFNGLLWNIVRLNQPNANLMPISQKHRASLVNSTILLKIPQISQKMPLLPCWVYLDYASVHANHPHICHM